MGVSFKNVMVLNADIDEYNDGRSKDVCMLLNKM